MVQSVRTRGLVLRTIPYSDTSQIAWVFARDEGILSLLAKGSLRLARRSSSFPAPFDLCGWYDIVYRRRGGDMHLATEARLVEGFDHLRRDLDVYLDACLAVEVMLRFFQPVDPHPEFLRGALSYFKLLGLGHGREALRVHLHQRVLAACGLAPEWAGCSECGEPIDVEAAFLRLPGGAVCGSCRRAGEERLSPELLHYLGTERQIPWGRVPALRAGPEILTQAWGLTRRLLLYHSERPLRVLNFLRA